MGLDVAALLQPMVQKGSSDIHFKADATPALRIQGRLISAANFQKLTAEHVRTLAYALMTPEQAKQFEAGNELDFAYSLAGTARFRINVFRQRGSVALTLRVVPLSIPSFEELNLPLDLLTRLSQESRGLILFAGVTGAGKTTTMSSFLDHLNRARPCRVITVEDPIEYVHQDAKGSIVQRGVGPDTPSVGIGLTEALRQDPDVVAAGELRDLDDIRAALTAAETGHLVLSTMHTAGAIETVDRITEAHPAHEHDRARRQLAGVLKAVVAQRLIPSADGAGRFPALEILIVNNLSRRHIAEGNDSELRKLMEGGSYYGMRTFDQDLTRLYQERKIDDAAAVDNAANPEELALKLKGAPAAA